MDGVMISIQPKWVDLIATGQKTIELRKTKPKRVESPFTCYMYETQGVTDIPIFIDEDGHEVFRGRGMVVGEFRCDEIFDIWPGYTGNNGDTCLDYAETESYLGECGHGYGWHISNLKMYPKPKNVAEFFKTCPGDMHCSICPHAELNYFDEALECQNRILRAPQSWCYVRMRGE